MNKLSALSCALLLAALPSTLHAQAAQADQYRITKILPALIATPQYTVTGDPRPAAVQSANTKWLEVQVQFQAAPDNTEEVTFKYYIFIKGTAAAEGTLLTGEVTHVNVPKSNELYSVMYVSPRELSRLLGTSININAIKAVGVQLLIQGQLITETSIGSGATGEWWTTLKPIPGQVLNKNETPFAPLYWDRFEMIKAAH